MAEVLEPYQEYLTGFYFAVLDSAGVSRPTFEEGSLVSANPEKEQGALLDYFRYINNRTTYFSDCFEQYVESYDGRVRYRIPSVRGNMMWTLAAVTLGELNIRSTDGSVNGALGNELRAISKIFEVKRLRGLLNVHLTHLIEEDVVSTIADPVLTWRSPDGREHPRSRYRTTKPIAGSGPGRRRRKRFPNTINLAIPKPLIQPG